MENRLNREGIKKYSERFTTKTLKEFFKSYDKIDGRQILDLQPIKQVNLFVIKNLFREWQKETARLKSNFFDYEHAEVQAALTDFMNVLSQHISINKHNFKNLFQQATEETILLIFSPYDFYIHILERNDDAIKLEDLKKISKYVKVNKNLLEILIKLMEQKGFEELNNANLGNLLDEVFANIEDTPEDIEVYLKDFTAAVPLRVEDLYLEEDEPILESAEEANEISFQWTVEPQKTLHDELSNSSQTTLADIHGNKRIESILNSLSINQKFMFINTLFQSDEDRFKRVVDYIEQLEDEQKAFQYLYDEFPDWDSESEEVVEFFEVVSRRMMK